MLSPQNQGLFQSQVPGISHPEPIGDLFQMSAEDLELAPLREAASGGCRTSQLFLGSYFVWPGKAHRNVDEASYWLEKASSQGCEQARALLASLCVHSAQALLA